MTIKNNIWLNDWMHEQWLMNKPSWSLTILNQEEINITVTLFKEGENQCKPSSFKSQGAYNKWLKMNKKPECEI